MDANISQRLAEIRRLRYGERGKSSFARDLGIPVTSYVHYEAGRMPPADVLVCAAKIAGVHLDWLLCGEGHRDRPSSFQDSRQSQKLADRLFGILEGFPHLAPSAEELLQLLERVRTVQNEPLNIRPGIEASLVPVVGSTAAGLARFWTELEETRDGPAADAQLERMLSEYGDRTLRNNAPIIGGATDMGDQVALVQYSSPNADGFLEFLSAVSVKTRYPKAVAWRIDGESMSPRYSDGDFVITSPDQPAVEMHPCVARQKSQIGVNCKLFQSAGDNVLLIPINERYSVQQVPRELILWAWRVVASVRLG